MRTKIVATQTNRPSTSLLARSRSAPLSFHQYHQQPSQDVSTSSGEDSFSASDASFADFDALNDTMSLLEASAATYSPDFWDRAVDALVGAPKLSSELESSFAECDDSSYMYDINNNVTTLDDTETTDFDVDATHNESTNSTFVDDMNTTGMATVATTLALMRANFTRKASRFTKVVGARNVQCDADASAFYHDDEDTASSTPNVAARALRRFSSSLSLSTRTKRSDVRDIAINSTASRGREAELQACELKSTRSYLVEAGDDVLLHEYTTTTSVGHNTTAQQFISDEGFPTTWSASGAESVNLKSTSPRQSTAATSTKAAYQSTTAGTTSSPDLAALAPVNPKSTLAGSTIVCHVEELLNEIYGPPRTEFGEQSSLVRAQLIVDKYRTRPKDLIRVLEKKAAAKKAAEVSTSKNVSGMGANHKNMPSAKDVKAKLDNEANQAASIQPSQTKPTAGGASLTRRLRSFGRSASTTLRTRSRSIERFRRLRSNTFDGSENYSTPEKARGKHSVHTPDTVENDCSDENDSSFSPLSNIGFYRGEF